MELDPKIKQLADAFDCEYPKHYLVVSDYQLVDDKIVIGEIKVLDVKGKFIKLASLTKVIKALSQYPIKFEKQ
jgi:hypothetical protein